MAVVRRWERAVGLVVRTIVVVGTIYVLSPVNTGETPDVRALAARAVPALAELPASTGSLGRDAAAAALAACAARPQACADMAATLRGTAVETRAATTLPATSVPPAAPGPRAAPR